MPRDPARPAPWAERPLLLDGGLGSSLIARGLPLGMPPERWNLEQPQQVGAVHRSFAEAGSDVLHTNSFGANPPKLAAGGLAGLCRELNGAAVRLARDAAASARPGILIAGDIGPTGLLLPPLGPASEDELQRAFREQAEILAEAGADLLSIETMFDLREAQAALAAARTTGLPVLVSLTFERKRRGFFTLMGDPLLPALQALAARGAAAVGFNCTVESPTMVEMAQLVRGGLTVPLVAQPNAGQPRATPAGVVYDADPEQFARDLMRLVVEGARLVGGCCGTDERFLAAARRALDAELPALA
ncbi:MAG: homocysteine S-methyltransferase family protein [Deltaproteobacteria bacterium]|nr:homocysteine S-methyltransferase family protein [Deltaproteobacteria bacterium]